ncbi:MAG: AAA family ATPase [Cyanobacteria bacterium P01_H01_bin.121]
MTSHSILISGTHAQAGQSLLTAALQSYVQRYGDRQSLSVMKLTHGLDLAQTWQDYSRRRETHDWVILETSESLGSPLAPDTTIADLAWDWRLPVILVVPVEPGGIGQAVAYAALARQTRCHLKGIILTCPCREAEICLSEWMPAEQLQQLTQVPYLGSLPHLASLEEQPEALSKLAANLVLERFMPVWAA